MQLTIRELNEIIYALGVAEYKGMFVDKDVNSTVGDKIRTELELLIKEEESSREKAQQQVVSEKVTQKEPKVITPITDTGSEVADFLIAVTAQLPVEEEETPSTVKKAKFPGAKKSNLMDPEK